MFRLLTPFFLVGFLILSQGWGGRLSHHAHAHANTCSDLDHPFTDELELHFFG